MTQTMTSNAAPKIAREAKAYATDGTGHVFCVEYYGTERAGGGRSCDNGVNYAYLQGLARGGWTVYVAKCPIRAAHTIHPAA